MFVDKIEKAIITFGKQLVRDEKNAAIFSGTITALTYVLIWMVWGQDVPQWVLLTFLPLAAPFFEKPFLFLSYYLQAWRNYREDYMDGSYFSHVKAVLAEENAWRVLKVDLLYHDSLSWLFMFLATTFLLPGFKCDIEFQDIFTTGRGLWEIAGTGLVGAACFSLALGGAVVLEIKITAMAFERFKRKLVEEYGFYGPEEYIEMLYVSKDDYAPNGQRTMEKIIKKWNLQGKGRATHTEEEIGNHTLKKYNNWRPSLQIRRSSDTGNSIQICYEEPFEIPTEKTDAHRCFAIRKMKWRRSLYDSQLAEVNSWLVSQGLVQGQPEIFYVKYDRSYFNDPRTLSVSYDRHIGDKDLFWIEAKIWEIDGFQKIFRELNEFIARRLPVYPSTKRKSDTMRVLLGEQ